LVLSVSRLPHLVWCTSVVVSAVFLGACATPAGEASSTVAGLANGAAATDAETGSLSGAALAANSWRPGNAPVRSQPTRGPAFIVDPNPASLIGMERADVAALLGPPKILLRDPPAEMWQYLSDACVLHVFIYISGDGESYLVRHVEVHDRKANEALPHCYTTLINAPNRVQDAG
jgi:hypothetical protein